MTQNLFSITIYFVVFREALEAALIISVLLSLVDQILHKDTSTDPSLAAPPDPEANPTPVAPRVLRKLKLQVCSPQQHLIFPRRASQVIFGALAGLALAVAIGAAFIAIWFTQAKNLWSSSEQLWEGTLETPSHEPF